MNRIMEVEVTGDFQIEITYFNGVKGKLNLKRYNDQRVFRDASRFEKFGLMPNGDLEWSGGIRISQEEINKKIILLN